ncbi:DUF5082 family protein [Bacillus haynesii]|uniref:YwqH-like family protein n=1 Tax=Bacillus haynesii TaxID=1925021 RepID=UPI00227ED89E|nr:DUF5082 family protein [Bacillus haynesii]MCY7769964.1 DUF5082 domain-containing protein [Bacillus haynesii]MCY7848284.1 DUF5082 domain-containing protein [Bacillus haynesii]MCY7913114.1 DUF5082 domain-containing protein [Bacillus haynesii]MCY7927099.1 DUF5082 domain-containing protein [Bacillus haynesii]MCY8013818.1 DUF5082 domain-containing protein [Bacillus haynesii]
MIWEKTVLYGLQGTLLIKKQQLEQLKNCQTELETDKKEFDDSKDSIKKPELSPTTWQGSLADSFKNVRSDMKTAYNDICGKQLNEVFKQLKEKISSLNDDIDSLGKDISSLKKKIEKLEKEEREARR